MSRTILIPVVIAAIFLLILHFMILRVVRRFRGKGAIDELSARSIEELGTGKSVVFRGLLRAGVIVEVSPGHYFFDNDQYSRFVKRRTFWLLLFAVALSVMLMLSDIHFLFL